MEEEGGGGGEEKGVEYIYSRYKGHTRTDLPMLGLSLPNTFVRKIPSMVKHL